MFSFQSLEDLLESIRRMEDAADDPIDDKDKVTHTHTHTNVYIGFFECRYLPTCAYITIFSILTYFSKTIKHILLQIPAELQASIDSLKELNKMCEGLEGSSSEVCNS